MGKDVLNQQLMSLKEDFSQLATHLVAASGYLQDSGVLPSQELIEEIITARSDLDMFSSRLLAEAESLALQPVQEQDDLSSLGKLESLLHTIVHAREAKGEAERLHLCALTILTRVITINHYGSDHFTPLVEIQN